MAKKKISVIEAVVSTKLRLAVTILLVSSAITGIWAAATDISSNFAGTVQGVATSATAYYLDCNGNDANAGNSVAAAWKSFSRFNTMQQTIGLQPGDQVFLKRGCSFAETLQIAASGSAASPILIDAYGTGNDPIINGGQVRPWNILISEQSYISVKNIKVINAKADNSPSAGLVINNSSNIILDTVTAENNWGYAGIYFIASVSGAGNNNFIKNCTVSNTQGTAYSKANGANYGAGILFYSDGADRGLVNTIDSNTTFNNGGAGISYAGANSWIGNNTSYANKDSGISLYSSFTSNNTVSQNTVYDNCRGFDDRAGINLYQVGSNNVVKYNTVHGQFDTYNNQGSAMVDPGNSGYYLGTQGIRFDGGSGVSGVSNNSIIYNVIYNEGDGVQIYNFPNVAVYNNTVYNSRRFGIFLGGAATTGARVGNNIVSVMAGGATACDNPLLGCAKTLLSIINTTAYTIDYNLYYPSASYVKPAGQDANALTLDPKFNNAASADFTLAAASPAINKGFNLQLSPDIAGVTIPQGSAPEIGAYEFLGTSAPVCAPTTCAASGKNCGSISDGCSGTLSCGSCTAAQNCTGNVCVTKTCTNSACCQAKYKTYYPVYRVISKQGKCCRSRFSSVCTNP
ncbi:MAG: right-handed parallel beta-helix repeat-containing protein [Patescibacteria group bacterium]